MSSGFMDMATEYPPIRVVGPAGFDPGTAQTPGSVRLAAVAPQLGIQSAMWAGMFEVKPGARTGIHHHGEQQTIAYVLSGVSEVRWGANGECGAKPPYKLLIGRPRLGSLRRRRVKSVF